MYAAQTREPVSVVPTELMPLPHNEDHSRATAPFESGG
jgi:hypothetical protein